MKAYLKLKHSIENILSSLLNYTVGNTLDYLLNSLKTKVVIIREDRIGHQLGDLDVEIYKAINRRKFINENTIFVFACSRSKLANKFARNASIKALKKLNLRSIIISEKEKSLFYLLKIIRYLLKSRNNFYKSIVFIFYYIFIYHTMIKII